MSVKCDIRAFNTVKNFISSKIMSFRIQNTFQKVSSLSSSADCLSHSIFNNPSFKMEEKEKWERDDIRIYRNYKQKWISKIRRDTNPSSLKCHQWKKLHFSIPTEEGALELRNTVSHPTAIIVPTYNRLCKHLKINKKCQTTYVQGH